MASSNGERQEAILQLRFAGLTYAQIAGRLGITRQRVHQLIAPPINIRDMVVQCAEGQCQNCGLQVNSSGHVHHISCHGENYNDLENLRLLCGSCHQRAHFPCEGEKIMATPIKGKKLKAYLCECQRCHKEWVSRQERPKICPYCKSAGWETPRKQGKGDDGC